MGTLKSQPLQLPSVNLALWGFSRPRCSWDNLCKETRMAFLNVL